MILDRVVLDLPGARLPALAGLPGAVLGFLPQALTEHTIFGSWTPGCSVNTRVPGWGLPSAVA